MCPGVKLTPEVDVSGGGTGDDKGFRLRVAPAVGDTDVDWVGVRVRFTAPVEISQIQVMLP